MKYINVYGDNYNGKTSNVREACRAFIVNDDEILICYENKNNQLMLPGGGPGGFLLYMDIKRMADRFIGHIHIIMIGFGL